MRLTKRLLISSIVFVSLLTSGGMTIAVGQGTIELPAAIADQTAKVESVKTGLAYCEGPAVDKEGDLFFSEGSSPQNRIWKVTPQGIATVFRTAGYFNGTEFDPQGRLVFCQQDAITRMNMESLVLDTLSKSGNGFQLLQTNDLSIATNGAMFFTNHYSGKSLFYRSPAGDLKQWGNFPVPNGVEFVEEKGFLYLCLSDSNRVDKYFVGNDGTISNQMKFVDIAVPDGITLDENYNVYVASNQEGKIYVYDSAGKTLGTITMQGTTTRAGNASNCIFGNQIGGPNDKTLYITGNGGAYKVQLKVAGRIRGGSTVLNPPLSFQIQIKGIKLMRNRIMSMENGSFKTHEALLYDLCGRLIDRSRFSLMHRSSPSSGIYFIKRPPGDPSDPMP
jgi:gluconolactonase